MPEPCLQSLRPALLCIAWLVTPWATADDASFRLDIGASSLNNTNGTLRLDDSSTPTGVGTSIVWDRDLGGDTSVTTPRLDFNWRFADKHRLDVGYIEMSRQGSIVTAHDLQVGGTLYPAGTPITSDWTTQIYKVTYTYLLYRVEEIEFTASAGLHTSRTSFVLSAPTASLTTESDLTAPLPVIGFSVDYRLGGKWHARLRDDMFFLDSLDGTSGSLNDFTLQLEHRTFESVGFGFAMNRFASHFQRTEGAETLSVDTRNNGITLYTTIQW